MPQLKLFLMGPPQIEQDGATLELGRRKAVALLAYLAVTRQAHSRDALATMFWPEADQSRARATLRRVLSDLNRALGEAWLETEGELVRLREGPELWVDVAAFQTLLAEGQGQENSSRGIPRLVEAAELYGDDFLAGFTLPDSPDFDEWQFFQAETLRRELAETLTRLVDYYTQGAQFETAIGYARCWLALDPLLEGPHQALMTLYARNGQRNAALRQYQACVQILEEELGVEPSPETQALYECIRRGEIGPQHPEPEVRSEALPVDPQRPEPAAAVAPTAGSFAEIRPATVLFAGLAGAEDALWESHPEDVATAIQSLRRLGAEVASRYESRLDEGGADSLQLTFGLPHLHEDDPQRAVETGLALIAAAEGAGIKVSVGISTGQTLFNPGVDDSSERVAIGPVVHLAARLQGVAAAGQVIVSQATYQQTGGAFVFEPLTVQLGGRALSAYVAVQALLRPEKVRGLEGLPSPLIGRAEELDRLKAALEKVRQERQGQVVALIGEAGLGKSRLVAELKQSLEQDLSPVASVLQIDAQNPVRSLPEGKSKILWLEGRCLEFRRATSYWPFIDLLQSYLGICAEQFDKPSDQVGNVTYGSAQGRCLIALLQELAGQGYLPEARLAEMIPLLGNLLSLQFGSDWDERLRHASPDQIRHQTFLAIYDLLVALAQQQPLALIFEDVHWADALSLELFSLLLDAIPGNPILLGYVYRPEPHHPTQRLALRARQRVPQQFTELRLRELTEAEGYSLVESLLGTRDLASIKALILKKAQGNPFFVEEAIRALIDAGDLYRVGDGWQARPEIEAVAVPERVQSVILSRIDHLEPALQQVLQHAAVVGRLFQPRIIAQTLPARLDLDQALLALEEASLIYQERVVPEVEYSFKHVLTQEAIYQTLSRQRRSNLHQQVAGSIEQIYAGNLRTYYEQLAYHYYQSEANEKAIEYMLKSAQKSAAAYFNEEAIRYFQKTLQRLETVATSPAGLTSQQQAWQLAALTGLGRIYHGMGQDREAEQYLRQALALGQGAGLPVHEIIRLYHWLAEVLHWLSRHTEQVALGEAGLALLTEAEMESVEAVLMNQAIAIGHYNLGNEDIFQRLTRQTAGFIEALPYSPELRPAYLHIVISHHLNRDFAGAIRWIEKLEALAETYYDLRALAEAREHRWGPSFGSGDLYDSRLCFEEILELYHKIGDNSRLWRCLSSMVWNFILSGQLDEAQDYADQALETAQGLENEDFIVEAILNKAMVWLCRRAWEEAIHGFEEAARLAVTAKTSWVKALAAYGLGHVTLARGQKEIAQAHFLEALNLVKSHARMEWRFGWWPLLACILSSLEAVCDSVSAFQELYGALAAAKQQLIEALLPQAHFLKAGVPSLFVPQSSELFLDQSLAPEWHWVDPFDDCEFLIGAGLTLRAANGRDLWHMNRSAPRLLRPVAGDFVLETICTPVPPGDHPPDGSPTPPAIGGLLLWQDEGNFLRLVWGNRGPWEISFEGCLNGRDRLIGQGRLFPADSPGQLRLSRVFLRLERQGERVKAWASAEGESWFSLGEMSFPTTGPLEAGLHAVGWIDRTFYPGAHPDGAAIRFEAFRMNLL